jgi:hypothetical protein
MRHPAVPADSIVKMTGVALNVETRFNENVKPYVYFDLQTEINGKPANQPTHGGFDDLSMLKDGETLTIAGTLTDGVLSEGGFDYL